MQPAKRMSKFLVDSIFDEILTLVPREESINLGSGTTEWDTPQFLKDYLNDGTNEGQNQYGRSAGNPSLVKTIAKQYSPKYNREIDPVTEVCVTSGATGGLTNACTAFVDEGDEVVVIEPAYEYYFVQPRIFGAKLVTYELETPKKGSDQWVLNFEKFEKIFNEKTRMLILNTPHNPTGKIFTREELERIASIVKKWPRLIVVVDEVYEYMRYATHEYVRFGTLEGMWERTISLYSASKVFACAGWRIGWIIASEELMKPLQAVQNWTTLNINRPTQISIAKGLQVVKNFTYKDGSFYYDFMDNLLEKKRRIVLFVLEHSWIPFKVYAPEGAFFILTDITEAVHLIPERYYYKDRVQEGKTEREYSQDYAFVRWLAGEFKIVSVPGFAFYDQSEAKSVKEYKGTNLVRFAFCRSNETLDNFAFALLKSEYLNQKPESPAE